MLHYPPYSSEADLERLSLHVIAFFCLAGFACAEPIIPVDFNRDVRPILSDRCYQCHGPDADNQKSDFRLDTRESAIADLGGYSGIVPGNVAKSELLTRIHAVDDDVMPPPDSKLTLSDAEKKILHQWIAEGAPYDGHWAFKAPVAHDLPSLPTTHKKWARYEIDHFIAARLADEGLQPSVEAERHTLIRRLSLDLTGLPPTREHVDAFLADQGPDAYEKVVDRLLASPRYGERMALTWLDAARYADSGGYQNDIKRSQWPWRDWVIDAYNANMPFSQFSIEQLAGDMLPDPSDSQRLATAFNRNHRVNNEGGIIPEEFLNEYVADRVETTSTVWLGLTVGCARCHDHKYDPIKQKEFYEMYAFFNTIDENGRDGTLAPKPNMPVVAAAHRKTLEQLRKELDRIKMANEHLVSGGDAAFASWMKTEIARVRTLPMLKGMPAPNLHFSFDIAKDKAFADLRVKRRVAKGPLATDREGVMIQKGRFGAAVRFGLKGYLSTRNPHPSGKFGADQSMTWSLWTRAPKNFANVQGPLLVCSEKGTDKGYRIVLEDVGSKNGYAVSFRIYGDRKQKDGIEIVSKAVIPRLRFSHIAVSYDGSGQASGMKIYVAGKPVESTVVVDDLRSEATTRQAVYFGATSVRSAKAGNRGEVYNGGVIDDVRYYAESLSPVQIRALATRSSQEILFISNLTPAARDEVKRQWAEAQNPEFRAASKSLAAAEKKLAAFEKKHVTRVSIMQEMAEGRPTYNLTRGAYDHPDKSTELKPGTFAALPPMADGLPANRLGLAKWLLQDDHPLTARVAVNRYWQAYFGTGLVKTPDDFGSQGQLPSHPKLLDWLALTFRNSGWDVKAMQKRIVMSATYRQASRVTPDLLERDPENRLLARGPRFRLYGQALRDQALAVSGLLSPKIGGAPVMPYQPAGLWEEVAAKGYKYVVGKDEDLYRRSMYTFWRRTVPPPSMMNFDNSAREICSVLSSQTNTPLQAMNLLNDPQFVEAARVLAEQVLAKGGDTVASRVAFAHRTVLARPPSPHTAAILTRGVEGYLAVFRDDAKAAAELVAVGNSKPPADLDTQELAAYTMLANLLLNLDETVTKE